MTKFSVVAVALLWTLLVASLVACGVGQITDKNGETNFALQTITDEDILGEDNFRAWSATVNTDGYDYSVSVIGKISSVWQVAELTMTGDGVAVITMDAVIASGNCRIVLVHDGEIVHDFNINGRDFYTVYSEGNYYVKLVSESVHLSKMDFSWGFASPNSSI